MGEIFRAEDADLDRVVAIKVLADRFADDAGRPASASPARRLRRRDSRMLPSTVTIFDVGEHDGRPYIVMEYLGGGSLADRLAAEGAQPLGRSLTWLGEAAAALDAAHRGWDRAPGRQARRTSSWTTKARSRWRTSASRAPRTWAR